MPVLSDSTAVRQILLNHTKGVMAMKELYYKDVKQFKVKDQDK